jgi:hypothetical protein
MHSNLLGWEFENANVGDLLEALFDLQLGTQHLCRMFIFSITEINCTINCLVKMIFE